MPDILTSNIAIKKVILIKRALRAMDLYWPRVG
jgi:hypothetical protein